MEHETIFLIFKQSQEYLAVLQYVKETLAPALHLQDSPINAHKSNYEHKRLQL